MPNLQLPSNYVPITPVNNEMGIRSGLTFVPEENWYTSIWQPDIIPWGTTQEQYNEMKGDEFGMLGAVANGLGRFVVDDIYAGTIFATGSLFEVPKLYDLFQGEEVEFGNALTQYADSVNKWSEKNLPIYKESDQPWWSDAGTFGELLPNIGSSVMFMLPAAGVAKGVSTAGKLISKTYQASRLAKGLNIAQKADKALKIVGLTGNKLAKMTGTFTQAGIQALTERHMEGVMEATQVQEEVYNKIKSDLELQKQMGDQSGMQAFKNSNSYQDFVSKYGEDKFTIDNVAKYLSNVAAKDTYLNNYANVLSDFVQAIPFAKGAAALSSSKILQPKKVLTSQGIWDTLSKNQKSIVNAMPYAVVGGDMALEGMEEVVNHVVAKESVNMAMNQIGKGDFDTFGSRFGDYMADGELWGAFAAGALGSLVMGQGRKAVNWASSKISKDGKGWFENEYVSPKIKEIQQRNKEMQEMNSLFGLYHSADNDLQKSEWDSINLKTDQKDKITEIISILKGKEKEVSEQEASVMLQYGSMDNESKQDALYSLYDKLGETIAKNAVSVGNDGMLDDWIDSGNFGDLIDGMLGSNPDMQGNVQEVRDAVAHSIREHKKVVKNIEQKINGMSLSKEERANMANELWKKGGRATKAKLRLDRQTAKVQKKLNDLLDFVENDPSMAGYDAATKKKIADELLEEMLEQEFYLHNREIEKMFDDKRNSVDEEELDNQLTDLKKVKNNLDKSDKNYGKYKKEIEAIEQELTERKSKISTFRGEAKKKIRKGKEPLRKELGLKEKMLISELRNNKDFANAFSEYALHSIYQNIYEASNDMLGKIYGYSYGATTKYNSAASRAKHFIALDKIQERRDALNGLKTGDYVRVYDKKAKQVKVVRIDKLDVTKKTISGKDEVKTIKINDEYDLSQLLPGTAFVADENAFKNQYVAKVSAEIKQKYDDFAKDDKRYLITTPDELSSELRLDNTFIDSIKKELGSDTLWNEVWQSALAPFVATYKSEYDAAHKEGKEAEVEISTIEGELLAEISDIDSEITSTDESIAETEARIKELEESKEKIEAELSKAPKGPKNVKEILNHLKNGKGLMFTDENGRDVYVYSEGKKYKYQSDGMKKEKEIRGNQLTSKINKGEWKIQEGMFQLSSSSPIELKAETVFQDYQNEIREQYVQELVSKFEAIGISVNFEFNENLKGNAMVSMNTDNSVTITIGKNFGRDSVLHEFAHILTELLGMENNAIQAALRELKKNKELVDRVEEFYPFADETEKDKEILAQGIAELALARKDMKEQPWYKRFIYALKQMARRLMETFGIKGKSVDYVVDVLLSPTEDFKKELANKNNLPENAFYQLGVDENNYQEIIQNQIEQIDELLENERRLLTKLRNTQSQLESLKQEFQDFSKKELTKAKKELKTVKKTKDKWFKLKEDYRKELESLKRTHSEQIEQLNQKYQEAEARIKELETEVNNLKNAPVKVKEVIKEVERKVSSNSATVSNLSEKTEKEFEEIKRMVEEEELRRSVQSNELKYMARMEKFLANIRKLKENPAKEVDFVEIFMSLDENGTTINQSLETLTEEEKTFYQADEQMSALLKAFYEGGEVIVQKEGDEYKVIVNGQHVGYINKPDSTSLDTIKETNKKEAESLQKFYNKLKEIAESIKVKRGTETTYSVTGFQDKYPQKTTSNDEYKKKIKDFMASTMEFMKDQQGLFTGMPTTTIKNNDELRIIKELLSYKQSNPTMGSLEDFQKRAGGEQNNKDKFAVIYNKYNKSDYYETVDNIKRQIETYELRERYKTVFISDFLTLMDNMVNAALLQSKVELMSDEDLNKYVIKAVKDKLNLAFSRLETSLAQSHEYKEAAIQMNLERSAKIRAEVDNNNGTLITGVVGSFGGRLHFKVGENAFASATETFGEDYVKDNLYFYSSASNSLKKVFDNTVSLSFESNLNDGFWTGEYYLKVPTPKWNKESNKPEFEFVRLEKPKISEANQDRVVKAIAKFFDSTVDQAVIDTFKEISGFGGKGPSRNISELFNLYLEENNKINEDIYQSQFSIKDMGRYSSPLFIFDSEVGKDPQTKVDVLMNRVAVREAFVSLEEPLSFNGMSFSHVASYTRYYKTVDGKFMASNIVYLYGKDGRVQELLYYKKGQKGGVQDFFNTFRSTDNKELANLIYRSQEPFLFKDEESKINHAISTITRNVSLMNPMVPNDKLPARLTTNLKVIRTTEGKPVVFYGDESNAKMRLDILGGGAPQTIATSSSSSKIVTPQTSAIEEISKKPFDEMTDDEKKEFLGYTYEQGRYGNYVVIKFNGELLAIYTPDGTTIEKVIHIGEGGKQGSEYDYASLGRSQKKDFKNLFEQQYLNTKAFIKAKPMEAKGGVTGPLLDIEKARQNIKRLLGDNIEFKAVFDKLITMGDGYKAFGTFCENLIQLSSLAPEGTEYHEMIHAVMELVLDEKERQSILKEAIAHYGITEQEAEQYRQERGRYASLSIQEVMDIMAEEEIAEDFRKKVITGQFEKYEQAKGLKKFLQMLSDFVNKVIGFFTGSYGIENMYYRLITGKYYNKAKKTNGFMVKMEKALADQSALTTISKERQVKSIYNLMVGIMIVNDENWTEKNEAIIEQFKKENPAHFKLIEAEIENNKEKLTNYSTQEERVNALDKIIDKVIEDLKVSEENEETYVDLVFAFSSLLPLTEQYLKSKLKADLDQTIKIGGKNSDNAKILLQGLETIKDTSGLITWSSTFDDAVRMIKDNFGSSDFEKLQEEAEPDYEKNWDNSMKDKLQIGTLVKKTIATMFEYQLEDDKLTPMADELLGGTSYVMISQIDPYLKRQLADTGTPEMFWQKLSELVRLNTSLYPILKKAAENPDFARQFYANYNNAYANHYEFTLFEGTFKSLIRNKDLKDDLYDRFKSALQYGVYEIMQTEKAGEKFLNILENNSNIFAEGKSRDNKETAAISIRYLFEELKVNNWIDPVSYQKMFDIIRALRRDSSEEAAVYNFAKNLEMAINEIANKIKHNDKHFDVEDVISNALSDNKGRTFELSKIIESAFPNYYQNMVLSVTGEAEQAIIRQNYMFTMAAIINSGEPNNQKLFSDMFSVEKTPERDFSNIFVDYNSFKNMKLRFQYYNGNKKSKKGLGNSQSDLDNDTFFITSYLNWRWSSKPTFNMPPMSDSPQSWFVQFEGLKEDYHKQFSGMEDIDFGITITAIQPTEEEKEKGNEEVTFITQITNEELFKKNYLPLIIRAVSQEVVGMQKALTTIREAMKSGNYKDLVQPYHGKWNDGTFIFTDKDGNLLGSAFRFDMIPEISAVNDLSQILTIQDEEVFNNALESWKNGLLTYIKGDVFLETIKTNAINKIEAITPSLEMHVSKGNKSYIKEKDLNKDLPRYILIYPIMQREIGLLLSNPSQHYKNPEDANKRWKDMISGGMRGANFESVSFEENGLDIKTKVNYSLNGEGEKLKVLVIEDPEQPAAFLMPENIEEKTGMELFSELKIQMKQKFDVTEEVSNKQLYEDITSKDYTPDTKEPYGRMVSYARRILKPYLKITASDGQAIRFPKGIRKDAVAFGDTKLHDKKVKKLSEQDVRFKKPLNVSKNFYKGNYDAAGGLPTRPQFKSSEFPGENELIKGTQWEQIHKSNPEVDMAIFVSGMKVDVMNVNKITNETKKGMYIMEVDASMGVKQQHVPNHSFDTTSPIGTQIAPVMLGLLPEGTYISPFTGQKQTREEIIQSTHQILSDLVKMGLKDLREKFNLTEESSLKLSIKTLEILREEFAEELKESKMPLDMLEGLTIDESGNFIFPLDLPLFNGGFFIQKLLSKIRVAAQELEVFGGSLVNLSDVFMNKVTDKAPSNVQYLSGHENKELSYKQVGETPEGKRVFEVEVLAPRYDKNHYDMNGKPIDINELNSIDERLLSFFSFRIPVESKHSIFIMKVVGFLPEGSPSVVVAPSAIIAQSGLDFDVDKLYTYFFKSKKVFNENKIEEFKALKEQLNKLWEAKKERLGNFDFEALSSNIEFLNQYKERTKPFKEEYKNRFSLEGKKTFLKFAKENFKEVLETQQERVQEGDTFNVTLKAFEKVIENNWFKVENINQIRYSDIDKTDYETRMLKAMITKYNASIKSKYGISESEEKKFQDTLKTVISSFDLLNDIKVGSGIEEKNLEIKNVKKDLYKISLEDDLNTKGGLLNKLIDNYFAILSSPSTLLDQTEPNSFESYKKAVEEYKDANRQSLTFYDLDSHLYFRKQNIESGRSMKGMTVTFLKSSYVFESINLTLTAQNESNPFFVTSGNKKRYFRKFGKNGLSGISENAAASFDIVKEPVHAQLNLSTQNIYVHMLDLAMMGDENIDLCIAFMQQGSIKEINRIMLGSKPGNLYDDYSDGVATIKKKYEKHLKKHIQDDELYKIALEKSEYGLNMELEYMKKMAKVTRQEYAAMTSEQKVEYILHQLKCVSRYERINRLTQELNGERELIKTDKGNLGPNGFDVLSKINKVNKTRRKTKSSWKVPVTIKTEEGERKEEISLYAYMYDEERRKQIKNHVPMYQAEMYKAFEFADELVGNFTLYNKDNYKKVREFLYKYFSNDEFSPELDQLVHGDMLAYMLMNERPKDVTFDYINFINRSDNEKIVTEDNSDDYVSYYNKVKGTYEGGKEKTMKEITFTGLDFLLGIKYKHYKKKGEGKDGKPIYDAKLVTKEGTLPDIIRRLMQLVIAGNKMKGYEGYHVASNFLTYMMTGGPAAQEIKSNFNLEDYTLLRAMFTQMAQDTNEISIANRNFRTIFGDEKLTYQNLVKYLLYYDFAKSGFRFSPTSITKLVSPATIKHFNLKEFFDTTGEPISNLGTFRDWIALSNIEDRLITKTLNDKEIEYEKVDIAMPYIKISFGRLMQKDAAYRYIVKIRGNQEMKIDGGYYLWIGTEHAVMENKTQPVNNYYVKIGSIKTVDKGVSSESVFKFETGNEELDKVLNNSGINSSYYIDTKNALEKFSEFKQNVFNSMKKGLNSFTTSDDIEIVDSSENEPSENYCKS